MPTKVAYCSSYGGFGLSQLCIDRMKELGYQGECDSFYITYNVKRHNPILIQAIEDIGLKQASYDHCKLVISVILGNRYKIDEYDGAEAVIEPKDINWISTHW
jgi:hypothetical protein